MEALGYTLLGLVLFSVVLRILFVNKVFPTYNRPLVEGSQEWREIMDMCVKRVSARTCPTL